MLPLETMVKPISPGIHSTIVLPGYLCNGTNQARDTGRWSGNSLRRALVHPTNMLGITITSMCESIPSKLSHLLLPANYPISISGTLSTTKFCHRGHYFFSLSPTIKSCFPLTFKWAPRACWGTWRMPIVNFLCYHLRCKETLQWAS